MFRQYDQSDLPGGTQGGSPSQFFLNGGSLVTLIGLLACGFVDAAPVEWPVAEGGNGHQYEAVQQRLPFEAAKAAAEQKGGHLVTITSAAENEFVLSLITGENGRLDRRYWSPALGDRMTGPWIGAQQESDERSPDRGWSWVTGETFDYTSWHENEPNDHGGRQEDVVHFFRKESASPGWNDGLGAYGHSYIVEYEPPAGVAAVATPPPISPGPSNRSESTVAGLPASASATSQSESGSTGAASSPSPEAGAPEWRRWLGIALLIVGIVGAPIVGFVTYLACRLALQHHQG